MTTPTTARYLVENTASGHAFGVYEAASADAAIRAVLASAGCTDEPGDDLAATEVPTFAEGDAVEGGTPGTEDWDFGTVVEIEMDGRVTVAWRGSETQTTVWPTDLLTYDGVMKAPAADLD